MSGPSSIHAEQAERDDAHLRSLGIKPELRRTLGFLSNFAIAFSFISVSTGSFGNFGVGIGLGGPAFFWSWPIVIGGQLLVALVFAELASHFPVAGSIYQWSKRLSNRTLGWFTGWIYFWAQVVTVTAVAVIVAFVIDGIVQQEGFLDSPDPTGLTTMFTFLSLATLLTTTLINAFGVRLLSILNNIGVATEIVGMFLFALVLLFFANVQPPSVLFESGGAEAATNGNYLPAFALGMFMSLFIVYGFDTAGTFGEETLDASRQAPRGVLSSLLISGAVGAVFLLGVILAIPSIPDAMAEGQAGGFPIATTIIGALTTELIAGITLGELYLFVILASVYVCTLAIQGAATRMMFSMSRDRHLPGGAIWGQVNQTFRTPANAAIAVGVLAALPILVVGPLGGFFMSIAATGLIYLSYFLCNLGVLMARRRGWPHKPAWFNLGRWGMTVNVLALVWGGLMLINIGIWQDTGLFGDFGGDGRGYTNPAFGLFFTPFGQTLENLPSWPTFEVIVATILVFGAIYYALEVRGRAHDVESDAATGESMID
ncbi:MAG TPA: amino acid permease [Candidatus Sulfomarinibacteraceae bacterium]|nr:amino acid permease [Candidatus Sulfomarinibacteraceae bacterium]